MRLHRMSESSMKLQRKHDRPISERSIHQHAVPWTAIAPLERIIYICRIADPEFHTTIPFPDFRASRLPGGVPFARVRLHCHPHETASDF